MAKERLGSPRARLFVALELPPDVLRAVAAWGESVLGPVAEVRLVRPEALHVTLVFLGYHPERDLDRIAKVALREGSEPFVLTPEGVVPVPQKRPRLFALSLDDVNGALGRWQDDLSRRLEAAGLYEPEKRPFWAHITLGRIKRGARPPRELALPELPEELTQPFEARRVTLFRSILKRSGAVYEPLASVAHEPVPGNLHPQED